MASGSESRPAAIRSRHPSLGRQRHEARAIFDQLLQDLDATRPALREKSLPWQEIRAQRVTTRRRRGGFSTVTRRRSIRRRAASARSGVEASRVARALLGVPGVARHDAWPRGFTRKTSAGTRGMRGFARSARARCVGCFARSHRARCGLSRSARRQRGLPRTIDRLLFCTRRAPVGAAPTPPLLSASRAFGASRPLDASRGGGIVRGEKPLFELSG